MPVAVADCFDLDGQVRRPQIRASASLRFQRLP